MKLAIWMFGLASLLLAGTAQASEPFGKVDGWEITAQPGVNICYMERFYVSKSGTTEGLSVSFETNATKTLLFWSTTSKLFPLARGNLDLDLRFKSGESINESWGSQTFGYETVDNSHIFTLAFVGQESSALILADLANHAEVGIFLGTVLLAAFPLAPVAVEKLTACAARPL